MDNDTTMAAVRLAFLAGLVLGLTVSYFFIKRLEDKAESLCLPKKCPCCTGSVYPSDKRCPGCYTDLEGR